MLSRTDRRGVTPAIAVALTVVLTIVLAAVSGFMLLDFQSEASEPTPSLAVDFSYTQQGQNVYVTHVAGSPIDTDNIEIRGPGTAVFVGTGELLTAGERFVIEARDPSEDELRIVYAGNEASIATLGSVTNPLVRDLGGIPPQITVGYEDLEIGSGNDYDYNDWAFNMETTIVGYSLNGTRYATHLSITFEPLARGGDYSHDQYIVPEDLGEGEYNLIVRADNGTTLRDESGEFDAETSLFLVNSGDVFNSMTNSNSGESCTESDRTVELELTLDNRTAIPDDPIDANSQHGAGLPFNLTTEPSGNSDTIGIGDSRLVTVPTNWRWPTERTHIADAYEDVVRNSTASDGRPVFETDNWFDDPVGVSNVYERCR